LRYPATLGTGTIKSVSTLKGLRMAALRDPFRVA